MKTSRPCVLDAWEQTERELRGWLVRQAKGDEALAESEDATWLEALERFREGSQSRS